MSHRAALALAVCAAAFALLTTWVGAMHGAPLDFLVADGLLGSLFLVAGVAALQLRPASVAGPLLIACTFGWFAGSYAPTGDPVLTNLGFAFERYYDLALAALVIILSSTSQRLRPRWPIIGLAAAMAVRSLGRLFISDPSTAPGCEGCPANPFAVWPNFAAFEVVEIVSSAAICAIAILVGVTAVRRLLTGSAMARSARWPIVVAGTIAMSAAAWDAFEYAWTTAGNPLPLDPPDPWGTVVSWAVFAGRSLVPIGFLAGALRLRRRAGPLAPLAAQLGAEGSTDAVGDALRTALGDPSLRLLRATPTGGWRAEDGAATDAPVEGDGRAVTLIGPAEAPTAALVHDPAVLDAVELLDAVRTLLHLTLENERLQAELREQLAAVSDSRARIVTAAQDERRRLERDLHDGAQARLIGVTLAIQQARAAADEAGAVGEVSARLETAARETSLAIRELREIARGIHPAILEDEGVGAAVTAFARRAAIPVDVRLDIGDRLPPVVEATAYFTVAEALTNIQRHARARSGGVQIVRRNGILEIEVRDDGDGGADGSRGSGLRGLADRVAAIGGQLSVDSPRGHGTTVRASIPIP